MSYVRARVKKNKSAERLNRRLQRWRTIVCGRAASERAIRLHGHFGYGNRLSYRPHLRAKSKSVMPQLPTSWQSLDSKSVCVSGQESLGD